MKGILYFAGFFVVAFAVVPFFSPDDPERVGVEGSLLAFGLCGAAVSCSAYRLRALSYELPFAKAASFILGAACSVVFYLSVALAFPAMSFLIAVGIASACATAFAVGLPAVVRRAGVQQAVQRDGPASGGSAR